MKIDKKLIKELVENLKDFGLTELEYQEGQTKIKVSKAAKSLVEQSKTSALVSPNKAVLNTVDENIIGGFNLKIGDKMIDCTVSNKLNELRKKLINN